MVLGVEFVTLRREPGALLFGIDEAGRGPVVGPLVMACVGVRPEDERALRALGVKDSKQLSRATRERLFYEILRIAKVVVVAKVPPRVIDSYVERHRYNELEAKVACELLRRATDVAERVIVDAPSSPRSYESLLKRYLTVTVKELIVENKADQRHPVVSAASVIAKVVRDREVMEISRRVGFDVGSGYPSDPRTREVLPKLISLCPEVVRRSWSTVKSLLTRRITEWLVDEC